MGATTFITVGWGRGAREAFNAAVEHAQYEHGHGGYSGTIAEKHSFTLYHPPKGTRASVDALSRAAMSVEFAYYDSQFDVRSGVWCRPNAKERARIDRNVKRQNLETLKRCSVPASQLDFVRKLASATDDKWGPAGALEVTGSALRDMKKLTGRVGSHEKAFVFFGWTPC